MFLETQKIKTEYIRQGKTGRSHTYCRYKTVAFLLCDACQQPFQRELGNTERKRLSNRYQHVCHDCDQKSFAQRIGIENKKFWNISVNQDLDISKF